jgi:hypothetical protein
MLQFSYVRNSLQQAPFGFATRFISSRVMPARLLLTATLLTWSLISWSQSFLHEGCDSTCLPILTDVSADAVLDCNTAFPPFDLPSSVSCEDVPVTNMVSVELDQTLVTSYDLTTALGVGADWALWLGGFDDMGLGASPYFNPTEEGVVLNLYANGTARILGDLVNDEDDTQQFHLDLFLQYGQDYTSWEAQGRLAKDDLGLGAYVDWNYFEVVDTLSRLEGMGAYEGDMLYMDHMPFSRLFGFQLGADGANNKNTNFGMSGWFWYRGMMAGQPVNGTGDVNADLVNPTDIPVSCPVVESRERLVLAWSECGHDVHSHTIQRHDLEAPYFVSLPPLEAVECTELPDTAEFDAFIVGDDCGSDLSLEVLSDVVVGPPCNQQLTRTWRLTDACENHTDTFQVVTLIDTTGPMFVLEDVFLDCTEWDAFEPTAPVITDNCSPAEDILTSYTEGEPVGAFPSDFTIELVYTATDLCGNSTTQTATITVTDTVAPVLTDLPEDATLSCVEWANYEATPPSAADNCTDNLGAPQVDTLVTEGSCPGSFTVSLTYTFVDLANNATEHEQTLTVVDETAPVVTSSPEDLVIECTAPWPEAEGENLPTATDDCSGVIITWSDDTTFATCPGDQIVRTFNIADACGNATSVVQTIQREDTTGPTFDSLPEDIALACGEDIPATEITATDACSEASVSSEVDTLFSACPGNYTLIRTFTAVDACGNATQHQQTLEVTDEVAPFFTSVPEAITLLCDEELPSDLPTAEDDCSSPVQVTLLSIDSVAGVCPQAWSITRTFQAMDACGNSSEASQLISVVDTVGPALLLGLDPVTLECGDLLPTNLPSFADACDPTVEVIELLQDTVLGECTGAYAVTRNFEAVDACGNTSTFSQVVSYEDTEGPVVDASSVPEDVTIQCGDALPTDLPLAEDGCGSVTLTTTVDSLGTDSICLAAQMVTRTFTFADDCGNTSTASQVITVVDTISPEFDVASIPTDSTFNCTDVHPTCADFDVLAYDDCGSTAVDCQIDTVPTACPGTFTLVMTLTASDDCGNSTDATVTFEVEDTTGPELDLASLPADTTVQCGFVPDVMDSTAFSVTDDCNGWTFGAVRDTTGEEDSPCNYTHTDTYTFTDCDGNETVFVQLLTVIDTIGPSMSTAIAEELSFYCPFEVPEYTVPQFANDNDFPFAVTDNCAAQEEISITYKDSILAENGNDFTVERTWTLTDHCDNKTDVVQVIIVQEPQLMMPNAFSPGTNGYNDEYAVENLALEDNGDVYPPCDWSDDPTMIHFMVFNRWGNQVYSSPPGARYLNDWNGKSANEEDLVDGTYFVLLRINETRKLGTYVDIRKDQ